MTTSEQSSGTTETEAEPQTIEEIEAEIEQTREALGATVDELSHRLDVKGRAHDKVLDVKAAAQEKAADVKTAVHDKTAVIGSQITDVGGRVKPIAQRRPVQAAVGGAVLIGIGTAVARRRGK